MQLLAKFPAQKANETREEWEDRWERLKLGLEAYGAHFDWKPDPQTGDRVGSLTMDEGYHGHFFAGLGVEFDDQLPPAPKITPVVYEI